MKKLLVIGAMCALSALGAYAMQYITSCGIIVETVSPDFFPDKNGDVDWDEAFDYYSDLDDAYCNN
ncbi:MAG: hypothetical protein HDS48_05340 [Bacteroides sp.]|nr:hypothetical protein [Bacteroides sp.]MDE6076568.1 hypothetical protein [Muribaculaceae bacterium]